MSIKKINTKNIFIALFCCIILNGCKKEPFDYRNKFLGNYTFSVQEWTFNVYGVGVSTDTTFLFNGNISYGSDRNSILITYSTNVSVEPTIYEDGTFKGYGGDNSFSGAFESSKKVTFSYKYGGLGGYSSGIVTGERK